LDHLALQCADFADVNLSLEGPANNVEAVHHGFPA